jgi:hypothetical protein
MRRRSCRLAAIRACKLAAQAHRIAQRRNVMHNNRVCTSGRAQPQPRPQLPQLRRINVRGIR